LVADDHIRAYNNVLADVAVGADSAAGQDMAEMPDACAGPDGDAFIHITRFVNKIIHGFIFPFSGTGGNPLSSPQAGRFLWCKRFLCWVGPDRPEIRRRLEYPDSWQCANQ